MHSPVENGTLEVVVSQLKPPHTLSNLLGPQFSLSVGGDCLEGWSDNSVSQTWGVRVWEKRWDLDHSRMCEKG